MFKYYAKPSHGIDQVSKGGMCDSMFQHWVTKGFTIVAQRYCEKLSLKSIQGPTTGEGCPTGTSPGTTPQHQSQ